MITVTNKEVRLLKPCIDPIEFYSDDKYYSLEDILMNDKIESKDRIWVVTKLICNDDSTTKINRRLAIYAANYAIALCDKAEIELDPRIRQAPVIALAYLNGTSTKEDLANARSAAADSARYATNCAAISAAYSAADSAATYSDFAIYFAAVDSAALSASYPVSYSADSAAAYSAAAYAAAYSAALSAAYSAAYSNFVSELLRLINGGFN